MRIVRLAAPLPPEPPDLASLPTVLRTPLSHTAEEQLRGAMQGEAPV